MSSEQPCHLCQKSLISTNDNYLNYTIQFSGEPEGEFFMEFSLILTSGRGVGEGEGRRQEAEGGKDSGGGEDREVERKAGGKGQRAEAKIS